MILNIIYCGSDFFKYWLQFQLFILTSISFVFILVYFYYNYSGSHLMVTPDATSQGYLYSTAISMANVPQVRIFTAKTRLVTSTWLNNPHSLLSLLRRTFHSDILFPRTLWNILPRVWFPENYNFNCFKRRINDFLSSIAS